MMKVAQATFAVACQTSTSAQVAFKWFHIDDKQTDGCNSPNKWLMSLAMDLAALCDTWR